MLVGIGCVRAGAAADDGAGGGATWGGATPASAPAGDPLWTRSFGDADNQYASAVAVDGRGDLLVAGHYYGTVDLGGGPLPSAGKTDVLLAKFAPDGHHLWSRRLGDSSPQYVYGMKTSEDGDVFIAGFYQGAVDCGGGSLASAGDWDVYVAKFAPDGHHQWSRNFGDAGCQQAYDIAVDPLGRLVVVGAFYDTVDFGGGELVSADGRDIFVVVLDLSGDPLWSEALGGADHQDAVATTFDSAGNVIVTGHSAGTLALPTGTVVSAGADDVVLVKLDAGGIVLWARGFGDAQDQAPTAVTVDAADAIVLAGRFAGELDLGGGSLISEGADDIFMAKLDATGEHLWSRRFGDGQDQVARRVAIDPEGNIILSGHFSGTVDFGGGPLTSAGSDDIFVAKFDGAARHLWSRRFGDADWQVLRGMAVDGAGRIAFLGHFDGVVTVGAESLASHGGADLLFGLLAP